MILETSENGIIDELRKLHKEAIELKKIFSSIIEKSK
jgi:hypothetical protein